MRKVLFIFSRESRREKRECFCLSRCEKGLFFCRDEEFICRITTREKCVFCLTGDSVFYWEEASFRRFAPRHGASRRGAGAPLFLVVFCFVLFCFCFCVVVFLLCFFCFIYILFCVLFPFFENVLFVFVFIYLLRASEKGTYIVL